jgi:hypothetical protein
VIQNQVFCFVAAKIYLSYYEGEVGSNDKLDAEVLWLALSGLLSMFVLSAVAFFSLIDRSYLSTFTTTMTGPQDCAEYFNTSKTDYQKIWIFSTHPSYYASIEVEVKAFVHDNWNIWQADKPDWFTETAVSTIPDRFIPVAEVERLNKESGAGKRRRSSAADIFRGNGGGAASVAPVAD